MNRLVGLLIISMFTMVACTSAVQVTDVDVVVNEVRPPAVPLVMVDPYFSIWSAADNATDVATTHWTGADHPLVSAVRVDGQVYRILGTAEPEMDVILPTIAVEPWSAKYVIGKMPSKDWMSPSYDDGSWPVGRGAFGSRDQAGARTRWDGNDTDIWVRRTFDLKEDLSAADVIFEYSHDDVFECYINGIKVVGTGYVWKNNVKVVLPDEVKATLKPGKVTVAAHCHNTVGGSFVDFGLFKKAKADVFTEVAHQKSVSVLPTRTVYSFECGGVDIDMIFTAPLLMDDLDLLSRPVNYVTWQVKSNDGAEHDVQVYLEGTPQIALDKAPVPMVSDVASENGVDFVKTGTVSQRYLAHRGDGIRIDWGYFQIATPTGKGEVGLAGYHQAKEMFAQTGAVQTPATHVRTENFRKENVALTYTNDLGKVGTETVCDFAMLAYDDVYSIQYFHNNLRPYWNRKGDKSFVGELAEAAADYNAIMGRCADFDVEMMREAEAAGGKKYAELCALAYRQAIAAHKLVEAPNGDLLWLSKENFSNGSIGTVDVTYPSAPLFLIYNVELAKGLLNHIFYYSESGRWTKPFAAHDVGTYPQANGQAYGGDMPVEESGNMIILTAAIAKMEGNAEYARKHWDVLSVWKDYLVEYGQDPANQLCTDDFAGHFAHNANLSVKAIEGVASYAYLAGMLGDKETEAKYMDKAREMAAIWKDTAFDGDHYRLTFDKPGTWSQKYNMVWDKMLGFNVFDPAIMETEIPYYLTKQNRYGLPLDNRRNYTKTDWIMWTATMAQDQETFEAFINPVWDYMNETSERVPMSDWIHTDRDHKAGFQARSVVGGYFIKMLDARLKTE